MIDVTSGIELAMKEFYKEYGSDAIIEDGMEFITIFDNCTLSIGMENNETKVKFVGGSPLRVNEEIDAFVQEESQDL